MKKFIIVAAFVAGIASPAFAQSFDPDNGTGNVVWRNAPITFQGAKKAPVLNGEGAYASDRGMGYNAYAPINSGDVSRTGGGSPGYNEKLLHD